eukprot:GHVN01045028.1.p1 GENE.GHVN01045028.1~~GHVN01045028.1.p1  ORF type:complete len:213 (-),score=33.11 GHVN01045028.1:105-743(-)
MTSKPKLIYFPIKGRGHPIRMALAYCDIDYDYEAVSPQDLASKRESYPFGQLPVLEVDGKTLCQLSAILHYVGSIGKILPSNPWEAAKVIEIQGCVDDLLGRMGATIRMDAVQKTEARAKLMGDGPTDFPAMLARLERLVASNETAGVCVGKTITTADFFLTQLYEWFTAGILDGVPADVISEGKHPRIVQVVKHVQSNPKVKKLNDSLVAK